MRHLKSFVSTLVLSVLCGALAAAVPEGSDPLDWPEEQRAFLYDGPGLLLAAEQREALLAMDAEERGRFIQELLARDPIPETPENELQVGIERRQALARSEHPSPLEVRAKLLFLNGRPAERLGVNCGFVYVPLEIWTYSGEGAGKGRDAGRQLVVYKPNPVEPWKLWLPSDSKRALYTDLMEYWMEQWEELRGRIYIKRIDMQNCDEVEEVDEATGVLGLTGAMASSRKLSWIKPKDASPFLAPPADLAAWARQAAATELPEAPPALEVSSLEFRFPGRDEQRMVARTYLEIPARALEPRPGEEGRKPNLEVAVDGVLEADGRPFEDFRVRYRFALPAEPDAAVPVVLERRLRPGSSFLLRLRVRDEVSGAETWLSQAFRVPLDPTGDDLASRLAHAGELLPREVHQGSDSLLLLPPPADVVLGLWRADTLVTGTRIQKVVFLVDGQVQLTRTSPPFSAEIRLARFPKEQVVRAEGYDAGGELVAADQVVINQPRGALAVWLTEPPSGARVPPGPLEVKAEISVPDGRRVESLELKVNDQTQSTLAGPPWQARVQVPNEDIAYVTAVATLDDGSRAEAVRFVRAPENFEQIEVNLVELFVAVTDRSGSLVRDLSADDFEVLESGKRQEIAKFELVDNLPLTVGVLLDTSGSMRSDLVQVQAAAADFLRGVITPRDKTFAVSFASRPRLEMPPTDDVEAVAASFENLQAVGDTALYDALVHSLYYFRGIKGQKALVLLSDGEDNASYIKFNDAMEYARRSGVAIYSIGYNLPALAAGVRGKLTDLAQATGGKSFFTSKPEDLPAIYKEIERELRSRYLIAYNSNQSGEPGGFREVEVKLQRRGLQARTARGYYLP